MALVLLTSGCKDEKSHRSYQEIEVKSTGPAANVPQGSTPSITEPSGKTAKLEWQTPEGWTEEKGSGMRLTTFFFNTNNKTAECTIIMLPGDAGGIVDNVVR